MPTPVETLLGIDTDELPDQHLRTWCEGDYRLEMYDTYAQDWRNQTRIAYEFYHGAELIFSGLDFAGSPMHADDSDETVASMLSWLSLKPGDTDREYFDGYTARQLEWCQEFGEDVSMYAFYLRETAA